MVLTNSTNAGVVLDSYLFLQIKFEAGFIQSYSFFYTPCISPSLSFVSPRLKILVFADEAEPLLELGILNRPSMYLTSLMFFLAHGSLFTDAR
jgi:hypothetical protein